jgi:hypothetical protein
MRIIKIKVGENKLSLVAGLIWHPFESSTSSAQSKEMSEFVKLDDATLKIYRGNENLHVGLSNGDNGARSGDISIAAVIANELESTNKRNALVVLAVPETNDSFIFVSIRENVILADGDVVGSKKDIFDRFINDISYGGWDAVICPADWIDDADERSLLSFFSNTPLKKLNKCKLKEANLRLQKFIIPIGLTAVLIFCANYGWEYWNAKNAEIEENKAKQELLAAAERAALVIPVEPWIAMTEPVSFAQSCMAAFNQVGLSAGNWEFSSATCENGKLVVKWIKPNSSAWVSHLLIIRPSAVIDPSGTSATVTVPAQGKIDLTKNSPLLSKADANFRLSEFSSRYDFVIAAEDEKPLTGAALAEKNASAPTSGPLWHSMTLKISSNIRPEDVVSLFNAPGLRLNKLIINPVSSSKQFQFSGIQYVR